MLSFTNCVRPVTKPSANLSTTLPTKPSQTTTSTTPLGISRPSILPLKLIVFIRSKIGYVARTTSFPLVASSPIFNNPTVGSSLPNKSFAYSEPINAPCTRCFGLQFELAPESNITVIPLPVGIGVAITGRSTPLIRPRPNNAAATAAPVLPGAITASQTLSRTKDVATTMDASFFLRNACPGCSSIPIT